MKLAYSGEVEAATPLQAASVLFERFNIDHPADYRNRSMSVGDVVVLSRNGKEIVAYACESVGWTDITETFDPASKNPEWITWEEQRRRELSGAAN